MERSPNRTTKHVLNKVHLKYLAARRNRSATHLAFSFFKQQGLIRHKAKTAAANRLSREIPLLFAYGVTLDNKDHLRRLALLRLICGKMGKAAASRFLLELPLLSAYSPARDNKEHLNWLALFAFAQTRVQQWRQNMRTSLWLQALLEHATLRPCLTDWKDQVSKDRQEIVAKRQRGEAEEARVKAISVKEKALARLKEYQAGDQIPPNKRKRDYLVPKYTSRFAVVSVDNWAEFIIGCHTRCTEQWEGSQSKKKRQLWEQWEQQLKESQTDDISESSELIQKQHENRNYLWRTAHEIQKRHKLSNQGKVMKAIHALIGKGSKSVIESVTDC